MNVIQSLDSVGQYATLLKRTLTLPDRFREFVKEFFKEMYKLGVNSLWIVMIISFFIGAVMVIQIALNVASPLLPRFTVGVVSREIILLEFSSTIMCLILAGKVGSNIASEIIIASVAAYFGYYAKGGSLDVGKASTDSVVMNSILILITDLAFTQLVMG